MTKLGTTLIFLGAAIFSSCGEKTVVDNSIEAISIDSGWQFAEKGTDQLLPATVPGNIHVDLINNSKIKDPHFGLNEFDLQWIGEKDWEYTTTFNVSESTFEKRNLEMLFEGLDTYADVYLNGEALLHSNNMFRTWQRDVKNLIKVGDNKLKVVFRNVFDENRPKYDAAPFRLIAFRNNDQADIKLNMYSRKAGYHYGWDWGPRFVTCGIWRPIKLLAWNELKIEDIHIKQDAVTEENAKLTAAFNLNSDKAQSVQFSVSDETTVYGTVTKEIKEGQQLVDLDFNIKNPKLWWTNGLGEAHLYKLKFIAKTDNQILAHKEIEYGVRTLEIVRTPDADGTPLSVKLNGVDIFMKGANYIPQDNFQNRVTEDNYKFIIGSAVEANMNMLRVWGGGIYENDIFYDLCDQNGILVWQDIMFACAMYPGDQEFLDNVAAEVEDNVKRLRNHPSLAMWCGNNENEAGWNSWGWKEQLTPEAQKQHEIDFKNLFYKAIPEAISANDDRYYHFTSPNTGFSGIGYNQGDVHYWDVWHGKRPFKEFNDNIGRFMSEYGFQSYPAWNSVVKFTKEEDRELNSEVMLSHQRCRQDEGKDITYGNRLIQDYINRNYNQPKDFKSYLYVVQAMQAEGIKTAIEAHRRNMPFCMGTLYWQINDCWPVASWSSIDSYGNWKALHYYVKRAYAPIVPMFIENGDRSEFWIVSDKLESVKGKLAINITDFNGRSVFEKSVDVDVEPNVSKIYLDQSTSNLVKNREDVVITMALSVDGNEIASNSYHYLPVKDLDLPTPSIKSSVEKDGDSFKITLSSDKFAKHIYIWIEGIDLTLSDNYFDLMAGETVIVRCTPKEKISLEDFKDRVLVQNIMDTF